MFIKRHRYEVSLNPQIPALETIPQRCTKVCRFGHWAVRSQMPHSGSNVLFASPLASHGPVAKSPLSAIVHFLHNLQYCGGFGEGIAGTCAGSNFAKVWPRKRLCKIKKSAARLIRPALWIIYKNIEGPAPLMCSLGAGTWVLQSISNQSYWSSGTAWPRLARVCWASARLLDGRRKLVGRSAIPARSCPGPVWYHWGSIVELEVPPDETPGLMTLQPNNTNILQNITYAKSPYPPNRSNSAQKKLMFSTRVWLVLPDSDLSRAKWRIS